MHIDTTMRRPVGLSPAAGDAVTWMLAIHATFPRRDVERAIDAMIAALDADDGDPDAEVTYVEDDHRPTTRPFPKDGPGCVIADCDHCEAREDDLWAIVGDHGAGDPDDTEDDVSTPIGWPCTAVAVTV